VGRTPQRAITAYRQIGCDLIEAKALCRHGEWLSWLKANVPFSERQARNYMRLAKTAVTADLGDAWRTILGNDEPEDESETESHNRRAQGTGENEWYTPAEVLEVQAHAPPHAPAFPCSATVQTGHGNAPRTPRLEVRFCEVGGRSVRTSAPSSVCTPGICAGAFFRCCMECCIFDRLRVPRAPF